MASKDPNYIHSDAIISDVLSPTDSLNSILSTPLTEPSICYDFTEPVGRQYKPKARKKKFQGNQHTLKTVMKNNLEMRTVSMKRKLCLWYQYRTEM